VEHACFFHCFAEVPDADSDEVPDADDPCPWDCENDIDGDGVCGDVDNCPDSFNPTQEDDDDNGRGNACNWLDAFEVRLVTESDQHLFIEFTVNEFEVQDVEEGRFKELKIPGLLTLSEPGLPAVPWKVLYFEVPPATSSVELVAAEAVTTETLDDTRLAGPLMEEDGVLRHAGTGEFYLGHVGPYPTPSVRVGDPQIWRNRKVLSVAVKPVTVFPSTDTAQWA